MSTSSTQPAAAKTLASFLGDYRPLTSEQSRQLRQQNADDKARYAALVNRAITEPANQPAVQNALKQTEGKKGI